MLKHNVGGGGGKGKGRQAIPPLYTLIRYKVMLLIMITYQLASNSMG